jgi:hypothetical protein
MAPQSRKTRIPSTFTPDIAREPVLMATFRQSHHPIPRLVGVLIVSDQEIDLLRSVLARAYEPRQPFLGRLIQALKYLLRARSPRKPVIESLNIIEKKDDVAISFPSRI